MMGWRDRRIHPSDEELLLVADRECSPRHAAKVREHLAECEACHDRMCEIESTLAGFISLHEQNVSSQPPTRADLRSTLKANLTNADSNFRSVADNSWLYPIRWSRQLAGACIALLIVAGSVWLMRDTVLKSLDQNASDEMATALPRKRLTPGTTRTVRLADLCRDDDPGGNLPVAADLEQQVLAEYGVPAATRGNYEVDYLITPDLGGSTDIHNLWPEPYSSTSWNAHVKDELENHLHEMVCQGNLPLATAQDEIATDWIAAYKREFHTDRPLTSAATLASPPKDPTIRLSPEILAVRTPIS